MATQARPRRRSGSSAQSRAVAPRKPLVGSETPRLFTPPLRKLTPSTSLGFAAAEFAESVCGIALYPWQRWVLVHALELAPGLTVATLDRRGRLDPMFRFRKVVVLVARQNGKSTLSQVLSLFFMYELGVDLVLGTAQDLDTAEEVWDGAQDIIDETPALASLAETPVRTNGKKSIRLTTGERYKVKAANRRAGRGLSGDLILLDELREHQSWDAWSAITKTTNARPAAMIWALSNAGDSTSVVLRYLRKVAHAALGDPDGINRQDDPDGLLPSADDIEDLVDLADEAEEFDLEPDDLVDDGSTLGLFEYSAPPRCAVTDVDGLLQANPSAGHGISLRTLLSDARSEPEWVTRPEVLCQWQDHARGGPFPPGSWEATTDNRSEVADGSPLVWCVDVAWNRSTSHIGVAGFRPDGVPHIELVASRAGTEWVAEWLTDPAHPDRRERPVVVQASGAPASSLIPTFEAVGMTVVPLGGAELGPAYGMLFDRLRQSVDGPMRPGVYHRDQPILTTAQAVAATRKSGDATLWDRARSQGDNSPIVAVNGALWGLLTLPEPVEPPPPPQAVTESAPERTSREFDAMTVAF